MSMINANEGRASLLQLPTGHLLETVQRPDIGVRYTRLHWESGAGQRWYEGEDLETRALTPAQDEACKAFLLQFWPGDAMVHALTADGHYCGWLPAHEAHDGIADSAPPNARMVYRAGAWCVDPALLPKDSQPGDVASDDPAVVAYKRIDAWRAEADGVGFACGNKLWPADAVFRARLASLAALGVEPPRGVLLDQSQSAVPVTLADVKAMLLALAKRDAELDSCQVWLRSQVAALPPDKQLTFRVVL